MNKREVLSIGANGEVIQTHESTEDAGFYYGVTAAVIRYAIDVKQKINGFKIVYADERETYLDNLTRTGALYIDFVIGQSVVWVQQYDPMVPPKISLGVITKMEATECKISLLPTSNNSGFVQKTVKYFELEIPKKILMKKQREIEELKNAWFTDPSWDIAETEGFEDHKQELQDYQDKCEKYWDVEYDKKISLMASEHQMDKQTFIDFKGFNDESDACREEAKKLLVHYLENLNPLSNDSIVEIGCIVDLIINASVLAVRAELKKEENKK